MGFGRGQHGLVTILCAALIIVCSLGLGACAGKDIRGQTIENIEFEGNEVISDSRLLEAIATSESSDIPIFGEKHEYNPITFQLDTKRIERLYKRQGYYQAAVTRTNVRQCDGNDAVCLTVQINEGQPTRIAEIDIKVGQANPAVDPLEIRRVFGVEPGQIFDHDVYLRQKQTILSFLKEQSYPLPEVKGKAVYNPETNQINIELLVMPGTAARIGYINFRGLDALRAEDVMARLPIKTGDPYDPVAMENAEALLAGLDVFGAIDIDLRPRALDPEIVDVVVRVRERPLKTLQFGAGVSIENTRQEARLRAEWVNRNFYDRLRRFGVRAEPRYAVLPSVFNPQDYGPLGTIEISFLYPAFLSPWQDLRTSIGFDSDLEQGYRWYGPRLSSVFERRINRNLIVTGGYVFRYLQFYEVDFSSIVSSELVPPELLFNRSYRLGYFSQSVIWDRRDSHLNPTRGAFAQLELAESAPILGSAFRYFRYRPELRAYIPFTSRTNLAARVLWGQIIPLRGDTAPTTERMYGGGANSHRGFTYHRLSPRAQTVDGSFVPVGGQVEFLFSIEQRARMVRLSDNWLSGVLFLDVGEVAEAPRNFEFANLHYAIGTGLRYDTPVGMIRADVGYRLNRYEPNSPDRTIPDTDQRYAIHVTIGEAF